MTPGELRISEIILALGLSAIAYFLKLIHTDLRTVIKQVHEQSTVIAVIGNRLEFFETRIRALEQKIVLPRTSTES
jgi:hypothetical protein